MHFHTSQNITFSHFPHRHRHDKIRAPRGNFRLSATKSHACHTSQNITFSHFPHRHRDDEIRDPQDENDSQTVHHPQKTHKKENNNPSLRIRANLLQGPKLHSFRNLPMAVGCLDHGIKPNCQTRLLVLINFQISCLESWRREFERRRGRESDRPRAIINAQMKSGKQQ